MDEQLNDIARRGLDAASELLGRLSDLVDDLPDTVATTGGVAGSVGKAWADVIRTTATEWTGMPERPAPVSLDATSTAGGAVVVLDATSDDRSVTGDLWVHNPTGEDITDLAFVAGPLSSADPGPQPAAVRLEPDRLERLAARSSDSVALTVGLGDGVAPGRYRGVVQVRGRAELWALVDLTIRPAARHDGRTSDAT